MQRKEYSAGAVKFCFWFPEFRKVVSLLHSGKTITDIKALVARDNIFSTSTPARSKQIFSTVSARVSVLSGAYYDLFESSDLETQKLINLIAIMGTDTLFLDFMNDVFREKLIMSDPELTDADFRVFFNNKQRESEKVAKWTDESLTRLHRCYRTYLYEAGLLERGKGSGKIIKPLVDNSLAQLLTDTDNRQILNILTGTR